MGDDLAMGCRPSSHVIAVPPVNQVLRCGADCGSSIVWRITFRTLRQIPDLRMPVTRKRRGFSGFACFGHRHPESAPHLCAAELGKSVIGVGGHRARQWALRAG
jgi:hypothetical protein